MEEQPLAHPQEEMTSEQDGSVDPVVPYVVARGDGSTGGGGLPMPRTIVKDDEEQLMRPKVGAEMPKG